MSDLSLQRHFPFLPDYMSWEDWNGNLAIYFGQLNIPFTDETDWQTTAKVIAGDTAMSSFPVPHPDGYADWQQWAKDFTEIVNGQSY